MTRRVLILACCIAIISSQSLAGSGVHIAGGLTHEKAIVPGDTHDGTIMLRNTSDEPRDVKVYQTDYVFHADGANHYDEPGGLSRSNASWITFTPQQFTMAPGTTDTIHYTIQAPPEDSMTGTYWSVLMVEPIPPSALNLPDAKDGQVNVGIRTVMRYAVQMVSHIGNSGTRSLSFNGKRLIDNGKHRLLQIDIENTGDRWLTPQIWADIFNEEGEQFGRFEGNRLRLYPGCSGRFTIDLTDLPNGDFNTLVVADNNDDHLFGTQFKLAIE